MNQLDVLYGFSSVVIVVILVMAIVALNEVGFRVGRFVQSHTDDEVKALTSSIQASVLGLLALLLVLSFSMSMQRYDYPCMAFIDEAHAIVTAILRVQLLPEEYRDDDGSLFRQYVGSTAKVSQLDHTNSS